jgi:enterochelin esterase family protein
MALGGAFPASVMTDVGPFVERTYRVAPGRANRAVAGLSMGGGHTLDISTANPGSFDYIGLFSQAGRVDDALNARLPALAAAKPKLVYVAVGVDDGLVVTSRALVERLRGVGLQPSFKETQGAHTWFVWREYLSDFAPQLFR